MIWLAEPIMNSSCITILPPREMLSILVKALFIDNRMVAWINAAARQDVTIRKRRLSFFGHICRLPQNTPARIALEEILKPCKKTRGGQKITYISVLKKDLDELNLTINSAMEIAKDRTEWRKLTLEKSHWRRTPTEKERKVSRKRNYRMFHTCISEIF